MKVTDSPHLDEDEQAQASEHAPLRPLVIHEIIRAEGESELRRAVWATVWSALAAGMSMGFSFATQAVLAGALEGAIGAGVLAAFGYTIGFSIVVLGRQQLFTESTLSAVLPVLTRRTSGALWAMLRLWAIVLFGNLLGTWIFAAALAYGHPLPPEAQPSLARLAHESMAQPFGPTLLRAIFAGWLIALMVWLLPNAGSARLIVIVLLTWVVAATRLSHIIAGSSEAAYGVFTGQAGLGAYFGRFVLPTLIGNTIGGVSLVALLNHAPVASEMEEKGSLGQDAPASFESHGPT